MFFLVRKKEREGTRESLEIFDVMEDRGSSSRDGVLWSSASDSIVDVVAMLGSVHSQGGEWPFEQTDKYRHGLFVIVSSRDKQCMWEKRVNRDAGHVLDSIPVEFWG